MSTAELRRQVNDIWKQAIHELEMVKDSLTRSKDKIEADLLKLRKDRDALLKRLGEQTHRLAEEGKLRLPAVLRRTIDRLNDVIETLTKKEAGRKKKKAKKKSTKKTASSKTRAKKSGTKPTAKKKAKKKKIAKKKKTSSR